MSHGYPKRPRFFAHRFVRLIAKACLANEIGPEACWLLSVIAMTEDAKGYRDPVTFYNGQLLPFVGVNSVDTLDRARAKAVKAGWLHYQPGCNHTAGKYWVTIPERYADADDAPSDESADDYIVRTGAEVKPIKTGFKPDRNGIQVPIETRSTCGTKPDRSAEPSSLSDPSPHTQESRVGVAEKEKLAPEGFAAFWKTYPDRQEKRKAEAAYAAAIKSGTTHEAIMVGLNRSMANGQWKRKVGIPRAHRYLSEHRWEDEPDTIPIDPLAERARKESEKLLASPSVKTSEADLEKIRSATR